MTLSSCVIPRVPSYQAPDNRPPSIESVASGPSPFDRIRVVPAESTTGDAGIGGGNLVFQVDIRDPDANQMLAAAIFLNWVPDATVTPLEVDSPLLPSEREGYRFEIPVGSLRPGPSCNRVELFVSSAFRDSVNFGRIPVEAGDLGTAVWWVARPLEGQPIDLLSCPGLEP